MNIFVDIDGTICRTQGTEYNYAEPIDENIDIINEMFDKGERITYWTARGTVSGTDFSELTRYQLQMWGCKYHDLLFGKPGYDLLICDKVVNIKDL